MGSIIPQGRVPGEKIEQAIARRKAQMRDERVERRRALRGLFRGRLMHRGAGDAMRIGRDSSGKLHQLSASGDLKMRELKNGLLCLEDADPAHPGKQVEKIMDVFAAVRSRVRKQASYRKAREKRDEILEVIEGVEAELEAKGEELMPLELFGGISKVGELLGELESSISYTKRNAATLLGKAENIVRKAAIEGDAEGKMEHLEWACAHLAQFRRHLGEIRDREVEGIIAYNRAREYVLRKKRDKKLVGLLEGWVKGYGQSGTAKWAYWKNHKADLDFADELEELAGSNMRRGEKFKAIGEFRERYGEEPHGSTPKEFVLELIGDAEREFRIGEAENRRAANRLLRRAARILEMEKPMFAAKQLAKTMDIYMHEGSRKSIASYVIAGAQLVKSRVLPQAAYCFGKALEGLKAKTDL